MNLHDEIQTRKIIHYLENTHVSPYRLECDGLKAVPISKLNIQYNLTDPKEKELAVSKLQCDLSFVSFSKDLQFAIYKKERILRQCQRTRQMNND